MKKKKNETKQQNIQTAEKKRWDLVDCVAFKNQSSRIVKVLFIATSFSRSANEGHTKL